MRISVVVLTYQGECFLQEQMNSILKQLGPRDEVVVSDDGSTDRTLEILRECQKKDPCIRLLQGPRQGIKKNMEYALKSCRGDYIFLADQDDIWAEDKVSRVMEIFEKEQADLVIHDADVFAEDVERPLMESFFQFRGAKAGIVKNMVKNSYIGCCMAFRRQLLEKALPIPEDIEMHDQWLGILNDFYFKKSFFYEKPLLHYRRHGENNSEMTHYGVGRMIRNRAVFFYRFLLRILGRK